MHILTLVALKLVVGDTSDVPVVAPLPGVEVAKPEAPTWCEGSGIALEKKEDYRRAERTLGSFHNNGGSGFGRNYDEVAKHSCAWADTEVAQKYVAAWRQDLMNNTGFTLAESAEVLAIALKDNGKAYATDFAMCKQQFAPKPGITGLANPAAYLINTGICPTGWKGNIGLVGASSAYLLDRPGVATPLLRMLYQGACLTTTNKVSASLYAACQADAGLTRDEVLKDAEARKFGPTQRLQVISYFNRMKRIEDAAKALWTAAVAKGGLCKTVLETAPKAAMEEATKELAQNAAAVELAWKVRDTIMEKPTGEVWNGTLKVGCDGVRNAMKSFLATKKPKTKDDAQTALIMSSTGSLLLRTVALCDGAEGRKVRTAFEGTLAASKAPIRGPREALRAGLLSAYRANMSAYSCGDNFDENGILAKLDDPYLSTANQTWSSITKGPSVVDVSGTDRTQSLFGQATVASVTKTPKGPKATFKKEWYWVQNMSCKNTSFWYWDDLGRPVYHQDCKWTTADKYQSGFDPIVFDEAFADGLKAGSTIRFTVVQLDSPPYEKTGFVLETVKPSKDGKGPATTLSWLGVPLAK